MLVKPYSMCFRVFLL